MLLFILQRNFLYNVETFGGNKSENIPSTLWTRAQLRNILRRQDNCLGRRKCSWIMARSRLRMHEENASKSGLKRFYSIESTSHQTTTVLHVFLQFFFSSTLLILIEMSLFCFSVKLYFNNTIFCFCNQFCWKNNPFKYGLN